MNALEIIAQDLFDKIRSRFTNLQMGDEAGAVTLDPKSARMFDFDFMLEGNNLGRVSISINNIGSLKVFYSQGIVEGIDHVTAGQWYDFLKEMRGFAKRRLLRFDARDISKNFLDQNDFQFLAQNGSPQENAMQESNYYGSSMSSYRKLENTKLILRHSKAVDENAVGGRSRHIKAIFIENEAGERFKYPFIHLAGAKAMQRHVANGGNPFDPAGQTITTMSEHIIKLGTFKRHVGNSQNLTTEAYGILDRASEKLADLRFTMEAISKQKNYEAWRESIENAPSQVSELDETTLADYKAKFTVSSFKDDLAQYFPLLNSIMQEAGEVDLEDYVGEDAKKSDIPAYLRKKKGGDWKVSKQDLDKEEHEGKISHSKTLAKNSGKAVENFEAWVDELDPFHQPEPVEEASDQSPEERQQAMKYIVDLNKAVKAGQVQPTPELKQEFENTLGVYGLGMDDEAIERAWQRITGEKPAGIDPKLRRPAPAMDLSPDSSDDDEDDQDVAKYRSMAKRGSIGQNDFGAEIGEEDGFNEATPIREIAEVVKSMFDPIAGAFPRGKTGVVTHIGVKFGDRAGQLAEKLCDYLIHKHDGEKQMEAIRRLSGLPVMEKKLQK